LRESKINKKESNLQRSWIMQLYHEHEKICWQYGVKISVPVIEISNNSATWGSWHAETRTLKISARLIQEYSWDVVLNILKHEMAHQIGTEIFHTRDVHGAEFDKACDMIGVPLEFRGASGAIPRIICDIHEKTDKYRKHRILGKVEKLLALADSRNEHEAMSAMEKANLLIAKYNLDRIKRSLPDTYECIIINQKKKRIENYQRKICSILTNYFFVKIVLSDLYDPTLDCKHKTIEILGTTENVLIANYVYFFLLDRMHFLWDQFRLKNRATTKQRRSYFLGVLEGFARKLEGDKADNSGQGKNVDHIYPPLSVQVCNSDVGLIRFMQKRHPRISHKKFLAARVFLNEYEAGCGDGKKLTLHKGISCNEDFKGKMLPRKS